MIICNGPPKAGTTLLVSLFMLLGYDNTYFFLRQSAKEEVPSLWRAKHDGGKSATSDQPGPKDIVHAHLLGSGGDYADKPMITIYRDPRNMLISLARFRARMERDAQFHENAIRSLIGQPFYGHPSFIAGVRESLRWRSGFWTRFEDMFKTQEVDRIARHFGVECDPEEVLVRLPLTRGREYTVTDRWSNWRDHWTESIHNEWTSMGGPALVADMGYEG